MKKLLFVTNVTREITNFAIPSIEAAHSLGYEFHMAANCSGFAGDPSEYGVVIHHIDISRNPFSPKNLRAYGQMVRLVRKEGFDMIHCNTPVGGVLGRLCGARAGVGKIIYTAHGFHFYEGAPLVNAIIYKWAEHYLAMKTDAIITINKEDYRAAQSMKLRNDGRVFYVPGVGIDVPLLNSVECDRTRKRSELGFEENHFVVIAVGRLEQNKNIASMIRAIARTSGQVRLVLCGEGEQASYLKQLAIELKVNHKVIFAGFRTDIPELLKASDAYLLTSYREGLSRSLMEAMAVGLPCVVSRIRGNLDLVEDGVGGYLLAPDDINGIAQSIDKLARDAGCLSRMGQANVEKIQSFDVETVKRNMKAIYEHVIGTKSHG